MNFKLLIVGILSSVLLFSGIGPTVSYAHANDNESAHEKHQLKMSEKELKKLTKKTDKEVSPDMREIETYASALQPYVSINGDGTISLDPIHFTNEETPENVLAEITAWMNFVNEDVIAGKAYVAEDLTVHWNETSEDIVAREDAAASVGSIETFAYDGTNGISSYWWGYRVYLDHDLSQKTTLFLAGTAGFVATVNSWISKMPNAPVWLIKGVLGTMAATYGFVATSIRLQDKGYGVYLRFTGKLPYLVYTGTYAQ